MIRQCIVAIASCLPLSAQDPPTVVSLTPADGAADVDQDITKLTVEFDRPMSAGRSVIGGGPNFPTITGTAWKNPKTFVIEVELEPDHDYVLGLNSSTFTNFRSSEGVALVPVRWSFNTLPAKLPNQRQQKLRNKKAVDELQKVLAERYSYYDLRVANWKKTFASAKRELLAAKTDAAWARAAARTLEPAADIHMQLRVGDRTFATGRRAVDPLYRAALLRDYVPVREAGNQQAVYGRTEDGIGYLMIASWTSTVDLDAVEAALGELRECKAMVVDARPNSGGGEDLALRIAAWFVDGTKVYAKNRYRVRAGKKGFGPVLDRRITGNREADRRITVPIAVLTSRYVMSSNEAFVLMLRQAPDCIQVGQPTFGCSGNPKPHELGNGVTIVMPSWQALRLDGTCFEGEGIAPDVVVEATAEDLESRDPILEKALELLRAKIGN